MPSLAERIEKVVTTLFEQTRRQNELLGQMSAEESSLVRSVVPYLLPCCLDLLGCPPEDLDERSENFFDRDIFIEAWHEAPDATEFISEVRRISTEAEKKPKKSTGHYE